MNLTDNQTASMLAGMPAGGVTVQGLNEIDGKFNISGGIMVVNIQYLN